MKSSFHVASLCVHHVYSAIVNLMWSITNVHFSTKNLYVCKSHPHGSLVPSKAKRHLKVIVALIHFQLMKKLFDFCQRRRLWELMLWLGIWDDLHDINSNIFPEINYFNFNENNSLPLYAKVFHYKQLLSSRAMGPIHIKIIFRLNSKYCQKKLFFHLS